MRTFVILFTLFMILGLNSCAPKVYYQVFEAEPVNEDIEKQESALIFENADCGIYYDFWGEEGDMGFRIENKTDQALFINLDRSYFVLNGRANDYFLNRVFTHSSGSSVSGGQTASASRSISDLDAVGRLLSGSYSVAQSAALTNSEGYAVSIPEQEVVCVPAGTLKRIAKFSIYGNKIRDCDLLLYPGRKEVSRLQFDKEESPVVFENRLVYHVAEGPDQQMNHRFYVSEIVNMPKKQLIESRKEKFCGEKSMMEKEFFKETPANKFYIKYEKGSEQWEH
ncbi:MAG: hypothetical protein R6U46_14160 [Marinilabilia sp.]